jgi:hypothetical protein
MWNAKRDLNQASVPRAIAKLSKAAYLMEVLPNHHLARAARDHGCRRLDVAVRSSGDDFAVPRTGAGLDDFVGLHKVLKPTSSCSRFTDSRVEIPAKCQGARKETTIRRARRIQYATQFARGTCNPGRSRSTQSRSRSVANNSMVLLDSRKALRAGQQKKRCRETRSLLRHAVQVSPPSPGGTN